MAYYYIQSRIGGGLVVSVDAAGFLVLDTQVANDPNQMWEFEPVSGQTGNYKIKHLATGLYVLYTGAAEGRQLVLFGGDQGETNNQNFYVWNTPNKNLFADESVVLRVNSDHSKNLNAKGGSNWGPGTNVQTYGWGGGDRNETWHLEEAGEAANSTVSRYIDVQKFFNAITPFVANNAGYSGCNQGKLMTSCSNVVYGETQVQAGQAIWKTSTDVSNNTDESSQETVQVSTTQTSQYSYSTSFSIKTTYSESLQINCGIGSDTMTMSIELSDTTTYAHSESQSQTFSDSLGVQIPAHSSRVCSVTLNGIETITPWTSQARIYGNTEANGHYYSPAQMLKGDPRFAIQAGSEDAYTTIGGVSIYSGGNNFSWQISPATE